jgi:predicted aspartyl protease
VAADNAELLKNQRLFELRRSAPTDPLYRAIVASRFGHEREAIPLLHQFLRTNPSPKDARTAHKELADAFDRLNQYRESAGEWAEALRMTPAKDPERKDAENSHILRASLANIEPQSIEFGPPVGVRAVRNKLGTWDVPVQVKGMAAQWIFDTGANISTLSESEAKRLGLTVFGSKAYVSGSTGVNNPLRLAVAGDLQFGSARLHNIAFLVIADKLLNIPALHVVITGILGLPVLRALGSVSISAEGEVRMHAEHASGEPNLFFTGQTPVAEVEHAGHRVQMVVDTGANASTLYPSFRAALSGAEIKSLRKRIEKAGGVGGVTKTKTASVPTVQLDFAGGAATLTKVTLLFRPPKDGRRYRDGVIGMDALFGGMLFDFESMRLQLVQ